MLYLCTKIKSRMNNLAIKAIWSCSGWKLRLMSTSQRDLAIADQYSTNSRHYSGGGGGGTGGGADWGEPLYRTWCHPRRRAEAPQQQYRDLCWWRTENPRKRVSSPVWDDRGFSPLFLHAGSRFARANLFINTWTRQQVRIISVPVSASLT